jgi:hypothetical protein
VLRHWPHVYMENIYIYIYILRIHVRLGSRVCLTDGCTCDFARFNSLMIMNNTERNTFLVRLGLSLPTAAHVSLRSSPFQPRSGNGDCRRRRSRQGRSRRSGRCTGYRTLFLEEATPCIAGASYTLVTVWTTDKKKFDTPFCFWMLPTACV